MSIVAMIALSPLFAFIFLIFSVGRGIATAAASLISQYAGKNDKRTLGKVVGGLILIMLFVGVVFSLAGLLVIRPFLNLLHLNKNVIPLALSYFYVFLPFLPLAFVSFFLESALRSIGEVNVLLYVSLLLMLINFFLAPLLIFGVPSLHLPALGLGGAALSNGFSILLGVLIFCALFLKGIKGISFSLKHIVPTKHFAISFLKFAFPASLGAALRTAANVVVTIIVAIYLGSMALAVLGAFSRVLVIVIMIATGISQSTSVLIAHALGSDNKKQALNLANMVLILATLLFIGMGALLFIISTPFSRLFSPKDAPMFARELSTLFQALALFIPWIVCSYLFCNIFMAAGNTTFVGVVSTITTVFVKLLPLVVCIVVLKIGLLAIPITYALFYIVQTAIYLHYYLKKEWLDYDLLHRFSKQRS